MSILLGGVSTLFEHAQYVLNSWFQMPFDMDETYCLDCWNDTNRKHIV